MSPGERKNLLTKYLTGNCTPEEQRLVAWLLRGKDLDSELAQLIEEMMSSPTDTTALSHSDKDRMYQTIQQQVGEERKPRWIGKFLIAASVTFLFLCLAGWYIWSNSVTGPVYHQIASGDDRKVVTMPDGTTVWLNSHSILKYTDEYGQKDRSVTLQGEAFFKVVKNKQKPFLVTAGPVRTRVLGTSFNVRAEKDQDDIAITLLEGKVAVHKVDTLTGASTGDLAMLSPDQQVIYSRISGNRTVQGVAATDYIAWKDDVLVLKNINMKDAITRIEKWYGVKIVVSDSAINHCIIHASFKKEPLSTVLYTIGMTSAFTYRQRDNKIILSGRGCL